MRTCITLKKTSNMDSRWLGVILLKERDWCLSAYNIKCRLTPLLKAQRSSNCLRDLGIRLNIDKPDEKILFCSNVMRKLGKIKLSLPLVWYSCTSAKVLRFMLFLTRSCFNLKIITALSILLICSIRGILCLANSEIVSVCLYSCQNSDLTALFWRVCSWFRFVSDEKPQIDIKYERWEWIYE